MNSQYENTKIRRAKKGGVLLAAGAASAAVAAVLLAGPPVAVAMIGGALDGAGLEYSGIEAGMFPPRVFVSRLSMDRGGLSVVLTDVTVDAGAIVGGDVRARAAGGSVGPGRVPSARPGNTAFFLEVEKLSANMAGRVFSGPARAEGDGSGTAAFSWAPEGGSLSGTLSGSGGAAEARGWGAEATASWDGTGAAVFSAKADGFSISGRASASSSGVTFSGTGTGTEGRPEISGKWAGGIFQATASAPSTTPRGLAAAMVAAGRLAGMFPGSLARMDAGLAGRVGMPSDARASASVGSDGSGGVRYGVDVKSSAGILSVVAGTRRGSGGSGGDEGAVRAEGVFPARLLSGFLPVSVDSGSVWVDAAAKGSGSSADGTARVWARDVVFGGGVGGLAGWLSGKGSSVARVSCAYSDLKMTGGRSEGTLFVAQTPLLDIVGRGVLDFTGDALDVSFFSEPNVWPDPGMASAVGGARITGRISSPSASVDGDGLARALGDAAAAWATAGLSGLVPRERTLPRDLCKASADGWVFDPAASGKAGFSMREAARGAGAAMDRIREAIGKR